jgi:hypothetical protein
LSAHGFTGGPDQCGRGEPPGRRRLAARV